MMQLTEGATADRPAEDPVVTRWLPTVPAELGHVLASPAPASAPAVVVRPFHPVPLAGLTVWRAEAVLAAPGHRRRRHRVEIDVVTWAGGFVEIDVRRPARRARPVLEGRRRRREWFDLAHAAADDLRARIAAA